MAQGLVGIGQPDGNVNQAQCPGIGEKREFLQLGSKEPPQGPRAGLPVQQGGNPTEPTPVDSGKGQKFLALNQYRFSLRYLL